VGIEPELVKGDGGILEITVDDRIAWTNDDRRGHIPDPSEAVESVRAALR
jgi:predicted Rdx family selenoprotein